jgi:hypothetical protein
MPLPVQHIITLREREPRDPISCRFEATCSCQWQGLAHDLVRAEQFVASHQFAQTVRGNTVIIERELLPKAEDAKA